MSADVIFMFGHVFFFSFRFLDQCKQHSVCLDWDIGNDTFTLQSIQLTHWPDQIRERTNSKMTIPGIEMVIYKFFFHRYY